MTIDESFDELYKLLRGSRCAAPLLSARSLFDAGKVNEAFDAIQRIEQLYESSRKTTLAADPGSLNPADKESLQLKKRFDKASEALELMKVLQGLLMMRGRNVVAAPNPEPPNVDHAQPAPSTTVASQSNTSANTTNHASDRSGDDQLRRELSAANSEQAVRDILGQSNELLTIPNDHVFITGQRFVIFSSGRGYVVEVDQPAVESQSLRVVNWSNRQRLQPIPLDKFHHSAARGRVFQVVSNSAPLLSDSPPKNLQAASSSPGAPSDPIDENKANEEELVSETADRDKILDMGAFTQLLDAAQRSGIVPGSGMIIQVRDCEYRLGKYNKALQMMETLYTSFAGAETQRIQRLQREEAEISSGRKKMSQRDLQAKRIKDNQDTQAIDRAKVRFQRVLEGLRGLLHLERVVDDEQS